VLLLRVKPGKSRQIAANEKARSAYFESGKITDQKQAFEGAVAHVVS
jgi:hypothetical protein